MLAPFGEENLRLKKKKTKLIKNFHFKESERDRLNV